MRDPELVPRDALVGVDVGLSVSGSADLRRLGLDERHADLAIAEITRAVLVAGGTLTYGGRISPSGFTQQVMNEVRRFGTSRHSLTLCLAEAEHAKLSSDELDRIDRQLGVWGRLVTIDRQGAPVDWRQTASAEEVVDEEQLAHGYSGLRRFMADATRARVLLGGKLRSHLGAIPGVIEEAIYAAERHQPMYVAGGFGGAATSIAKLLELGDLTWLPPDLPSGHDEPDVVAALDRLRDVATGRGDDGLLEHERAQLAVSHRPGEVASLIVLGLARAFRTEPA